MNEEVIEVTVDRDGNVSMKVLGVAGSSCEDLTSGLVEALGGEVVEHELTSDFYEVSVGSDQQLHNKH